MASKTSSVHVRDNLQPLVWFDDGSAFDIERAYGKGFRYCVYIFYVRNGRDFLPDHSFYVGYSQLKKKDRRTDLPVYAGSSQNEDYIAFVNEHPGELERYVVALHESEAEAKKDEKSLTKQTDKNGTEFWRTEECVNLRPGGNGFPSGHNYNEKRREEILQKMSESQTASWEDPTIRQRRTDGINKHWENLNMTNPMDDPETRKKHKAAVNTPEHRQKMSQNTKALWENPAFRQKVLSAVSFLNYKPVWFKDVNGNEFRFEAIKFASAYFGNENIICGWLKGTSKSYRKLGITEFRYWNDAADDADACVDPQDYPELRASCRAKIKEMARGYFNLPVRFTYSDGRKPRTFKTMTEAGKKTGVSTVSVFYWAWNKAKPAASRGIAGVEIIDA